MAIRTKSVCPSLTALHAAVRSAQMVLPSAAFSTLQPVYTVPSEHSSAAPTGKREYGEYECLAACSAMSMSSLSVMSLSLSSLKI